MTIATLVTLLPAQIAALRWIAFVGCESHFGQVRDSQPQRALMTYGYVAVTIRGVYGHDSARIDLRVSPKGLVYLAALDAATKVAV